MLSEWVSTLENPGRGGVVEASERLGEMWWASVRSYGLIMD